ncbi:MAG: DUF2793 domain-containing protein [Hasllibacter sp.]
MSQSTPNLALPLIQGGQAQKHVTHNEALRRLDLIVQLDVRGWADAPPAHEEGARWIVGPSPSGAFAGRAGAIAVSEGGAWDFLTPATGWLAWDRSAGALAAFDGTGWVPAGRPETVARLGIGTAPDGTNRLAVASDATLLTHAGGGHQVKVNKAATTDTASLLFQTGWSGRAEMGTAGGDGFAIKVSPDGASWTEALRVDPASGAVEMPATRSRTLAALDLRFACAPGGRWIGPDAAAGGATASADLGTGAEPTVGFGARGLLVPAGARLDAMRLALSADHAEVGALDVRIAFQTGPWNLGWNGAADTVRTTLFAGDGLDWANGTEMRRAGIGLGGFEADEDGFLLMMMRPAGPLGATRHVDVSALVEMRTPSS